MLLWVVWWENDLAPKLAPLTVGVSVIGSADLLVSMSETHSAW